MLEFSGIERTLPTAALYEVGYLLADKLDLVSAEPDVGLNHFQEPDDNAADRVERAGFLGSLCQATSSAPVDPLWALKSTRLIVAQNNALGHGTVICQLDTGVAQHDEIESSMISLIHSRDILAASDNPEDPLEAGTANPGHGTGTASVAASRSHGVILGAAPGALLGAVRCISDVKVFDAAPVAAGVAHAIRVECNVISMSLGGVPSRALHAAVCEAIDNDIIVVAAAGNCVRIVVWPARYDEVIAVAGVNIEDLPWKGSCRGSAVDISAPAENVWRAERRRLQDSTSGVGPGQGTSFATPLVAGAAALWLEHHTPVAIKAFARANNCTVQFLFKRALQATARRPSGWDAGNFGTGILDANALLELPLQDIPVASLELAAVPPPAIAGLLDEEVGPASVDTAFDWARYESELGAISLSQGKSSGAVRGLSPEAKTFSTRPSPALNAAIKKSNDKRLQAYAEFPGITSVARLPALDGARVVGAQPLAGSREGLAVPGGAGLENAAGVVDESKVREFFRGTGGQNQKQRVKDLLVAQPSMPPELGRHLLDQVSQAVGAIGEGRRLPDHHIGLEALVLLTGRPAMRVIDSRVDTKDPRIGNYESIFYMLMQDSSLQNRVRCVGRIDDDGTHIGTGFVVGDGIVLTNRHVLQAIAAPVPRRQDPARWVLTATGPTIDFADAPSAATVTTKFRIEAVISAGPDNIDEDRLDFNCLDAALLKVATTSLDGSPLPAKLDLMRNGGLAGRGEEIFTVGFPARPAALPTTAKGDIDEEVARRLGELFGANYSMKYVAPGKINLAAGNVLRDPRRWVFTHDGTTLGGNSGSPVFLVNRTQGVVGLHFAGGARRANYAHSLQEVSTAQTFLTSAPINWRDIGNG